MAMMDAALGQGHGGRFIRECRETACKRAEIDDDKAAEELWKFSERQITALEKEDAAKRARLKKKEKEKMGPVVEEIIEEDGAAQDAAVVTAPSKKEKGKVSKRR